MGCLLAFFLCACGGEKGGSGRADAGTDAGPERFDPEPPAPPNFAPCPTGWHAVVDADDGVSTCEPWPDGAPRTCAADEAHFPGGAGCERIGAACGASDWAVDLPAGTQVWYVRAGKAPGGDGTEGAPFGRLADALAAASDGDVVALSKGTFDEIVSVANAVTIRGACVAETTLASTVPSETAATIVLRGGAALENMRVSGARYGIDVRGPGTRLTGVVVDGATSGGVSVTSGDVEATSLVVTGTRERPSDGALGDGIVVTGGSAVVSRGVLRGNRSTAIYVAGAGASLVASDVVLSETGYTRAEGLGYGLLVEDGATASLARAAVEDDLSAGLKVVGASLEASDVVVRGVRGHDDGRGGGYGIYASLGATVSLDRVWIDDDQASGLRAWDEVTAIEARDLVVRGTVLQIETAYLSGEQVERGFGLDVFDVATVTLERAVFTRNAVVGVRVLQASTLVASDLAVVATGPDGALDRGLGLAALSSASVTLTRAALTRNGVVGLASLDGATIDATDLLVGDTREAACVATTCAGAGGGTGLFAGSGGALVATGVRSSENALCGVQVAADGAMDLHGGEIASNPIGANVQVAGYDVSRLQDGVVYVDNDQALDARALPLPAGITDLGE